MYINCVCHLSNAGEIFSVTKYPLWTVCLDEHTKFIG